MIPWAFVSHKTSERLRIKIPSKKGDVGYFALLGESFSSAEGLPERVDVNILTGSVFLKEKGIDADAVLGYAENNGLFTVAGTAEKKTPPISSKIVGLIGGVSAHLDRATKGGVDLANLAFIALISIGIFQILRGNIKSPPWYTAFWYAMGIFLKTISDRQKAEATME